MFVNLGNHLFLNYIFFGGQLLLINRGGIIYLHLALGGIQEGTQCSVQLWQ